MGLTYFKRFRMEYDLSEPMPESGVVPEGYQLLPFSEDLVREHATAKYVSFRNELDTNVFPCLGRRDGCLRLMREIVSRAGFVPDATWLLRFRDREVGRSIPVGTIQGLQAEGWGAISESRYRGAASGPRAGFDPPRARGGGVSRRRAAANAPGGYDRQYRGDSALRAHWLPPCSRRLQGRRCRRSLNSGGGVSLPCD